MRNFETSRSDSKARLVDALLLRGMLKIDAMSLADTLEGYPDLFVSALLGEGFIGSGSSAVGGIGGLGSGGVGSGMVRLPSSNGGNASQREWMQQHSSGNHAWDIPPPSYGPREMTHGGVLKYESYSDFSDLHQDPDQITLTETLLDSRLEGLFTMLSFGSFSLIPILIYTFLPMGFNLVLANRDSNILSHDRPPRDSLAVLSSLGVTSFIMFLLGAWKR